MAVIRKEPFGTLRDGRSVELYTLRNTKGTEIKIITYGARLVSWRFMTRKFEFVNVLLGCGDIASYEQDNKHIGAIVGRYGDGMADFGKQVWTAEETYEGLKLTMESPAVAGGASGNLRVSVLYGLSNDNELSIRYEAASDADMAWDMTSHACFNLNGAGDDSEQQFQIFSDQLAEHGEAGSCSWRLRDKPAEVEMELGMFGYDPGCPIDYLEGGLKNAAEARSEKTGIRLQVYTTQPCLRLDSLKETKDNQQGTQFSVQGDFCLMAEAPSGATMKKGEAWKAQTIYVLKAR